MRSILVTTIVLFGINHAHASPKCDLASAFASEASKMMDQLFAAQKRAVFSDAPKEQIDKVNTDAFILHEKIVAQTMQTFKEGCSPGDLMTTPFLVAVKKFCDFNKSIVQQGGSTVCVMRDVK